MSFHWQRCVHLRTHFFTYIVCDTHVDYPLLTYGVVHVAVLGRRGWEERGGVGGKRWGSEERERKRAEERGGREGGEGE